MLVDWHNIHPPSYNCPALMNGVVEFIYVFKPLDVRGLITTNRDEDYRGDLQLPPSCGVLVYHRGCVLDTGVQPSPGKPNLPSRFSQYASKSSAANKAGLDSFEFLGIGSLQYGPAIIIRPVPITSLKTDGPNRFLRHPAISSADGLEQRHIM